MNCDTVRTALPHLDAGALGAREAERLAEHLSACAPCRAERATLRQVWDSLLADRDIGPRPDLVERILAMADRELAVSPPDSGRFAGRRLRFVLPAAAAAAVLIGGTLLLLRGTPAPADPGAASEGVAAAVEAGLHLVTPGPSDEFAAAVENALADDALFLGGD